jgi:endonuclease III
MTETREAIILEELKETIASPQLIKLKADPFRTLILTIISQNIVDYNTEKVFNNLSEHIMITILQRFHGSLQSILSLPLEEARRTLTYLPGVGPKTAGVVLFFSPNRPIIPVDTHIYRVSRRLGLVSSTCNYEKVRMILQSHYHTKDYLTVHLLLIGLGRTHFRARQPLCKKCSNNTNCPSNWLGDKDA